MRTVRLGGLQLVAHSISPPVTPIVLQQQRHLSICLLCLFDYQSVCMTLFIPS